MMTLCPSSGSSLVCFLLLFFMLLLFLLSSASNSDWLSFISSTGSVLAASGVGVGSLTGRLVGSSTGSGSSSCVFSSSAGSMLAAFLFFLLRSFLRCHRSGAAASEAGTFSHWSPVVVGAGGLTTGSSVSLSSSSSCSR